MAGEKADPQDLLVALHHPLRRKILRLIADGAEPLSPREASAILAQALSTVSYHVRVLNSCGTLDLIRTRQVRGSTQHFYAVKQKVIDTPWVREALELKPEISD